MLLLSKEPFHSLQSRTEPAACRHLDATFTTDCGTFLTNLPRRGELLVRSYLLLNPFRQVASGVRSGTVTNSLNSFYIGLPPDPSFGFAVSRVARSNTS